MPICGLSATCASSNGLTTALYIDKSNNGQQTAIKPNFSGFTAVFFGIKNDTPKYQKWYPKVSFYWYPKVSFYCPFLGEIGYSFWVRLVTQWRKLQIYLLYFWPIYCIVNSTIRTLPARCRYDGQLSCYTTPCRKEPVCGNPAYRLFVLYYTCRCV